MGLIIKNVIIHYYIMVERDNDYKLRRFLSKITYYRYKEYDWIYYSEHKTDIPEYIMNLFIDMWEDFGYSYSESREVITNFCLYQHLTPGFLRRNKGKLNMDALKIRLGMI